MSGLTSEWSRRAAEGVDGARLISHPVNFDRLGQWVTLDSRILDFGCGYGRVLGSLNSRGYHNLIGVDPAPAMVAAARQRFPSIEVQPLVSSPSLHLPAASVDAVLLFAVLTCVPSDEGQRAIVRELGRVLRRGGLLYISDLWLQPDARNIERYVRDAAKYGLYGVFELPEGVTVRYHDRRWIEALTQDYESAGVDDIQVQTMNGHPANGFQWFGFKTS